MDKIFKIANSHEEIQKWVEDHKGVPAEINDEEAGGDKIGIRIDFPGNKDEDMLSEQRDVSHDVTWERFFALLDSKNLVFEYLDEEELHNPAMSYRFLNKSSKNIEEKGELNDLN
jgi:hypothetical protein